MAPRRAQRPGAGRPAKRDPHALYDPYVRARIKFILTHATYISSTDAEQALFWHLEGLTISDLTEFLDAAYNAAYLAFARGRGPKRTAQTIAKMIRRTDPLIAQWHDPEVGRDRIRVFGVRLWHPKLPWVDERREYAGWRRANPDEAVRTSDEVEWGPADFGRTRTECGRTRTDSGQTRTTSAPKSGPANAPPPDVDVDVGRSGQHERRTPPRGAVLPVGPGPEVDGGGTANGRSEAHGPGPPVGPPMEHLEEITAQWPVPADAKARKQDDSGKAYVLTAYGTRPEAVLAEARKLTAGCIRRKGIGRPWQYVAAALRREAAAEARDGRRSTGGAR